MKEKGKKKQTQKNYRETRANDDSTEMFKVPESCLPCKALFINLFWKFKNNTIYIIYDFAHSTMSFF